VPTDPETVAQLVGSVTRSVRKLGLRADEPHVLGSGANLVIHLSPSPVVARVATLTAEMRHNPADYLRRERDVTTALTDLGLQVAAPTALVDPGPHSVDGHWFLLMAYRRLEPVDLTSPDHALAVGRSLADLERALAGLPPEWGAGDQGHPWDEVARLTATVVPTTPASAMARIAEAVDTLRAIEPEEPRQMVHGDAHRVNVALDGGEAVWFDFEDANRRPLAWDLATLRRSWPAAGDEACRGLNVDTDGFAMAWHHEFREVYALLWNLLYTQRDHRAQAATIERLEGWLVRDELANLADRADR
jgi:Ser/Thr protein kinase RdoA (MazF antagonist)